MISAGERFCGEDWSKLRVKDPSLEEEDLLRYCFSSAYIVSLLHDTLGVPLDDERYIHSRTLNRRLRSTVLSRKLFCFYAESGLRIKQEMIYR